MEQGSVTGSWQGVVTAPRTGRNMNLSGLPPWVERRVLLYTTLPMADLRKTSITPGAATEIEMCGPSVSLGGNKGPTKGRKAQSRYDARHVSVPLCAYMQVTYLP